MSFFRELFSKNEIEKTPIQIALDAAVAAATNAKNSIFNLCDKLAIIEPYRVKDDIITLKDLSKNAFNLVIEASRKAKIAAETNTNADVIDAEKETNIVKKKMGELQKKIFNLNSNTNKATLSECYETSKDVQEAATLAENKWKTLTQPVSKDKIILAVRNAKTMAEEAKSKASILLKATATELGAENVNVGTEAKNAIDSAWSAANNVMNIIKRADGTIKDNIVKEEIDKMVDNALTQCTAAKKSLVPITIEQLSRFRPNIITASNAMHDVLTLWIKIEEKIMAMQGGHRKQTHRKRKQTHRKRKHKQRTHRR